MLGRDEHQKNEREKRRLFLSVMVVTLLVIGFTMMIVFGSVLHSTLYSTGWLPFIMFVSVLLMAIGLGYIFYTLLFWRRS